MQRNERRSKLSKLLGASPIAMSEAAEVCYLVTTKAFSTARKTMSSLSPSPATAKSPVITPDMHTAFADILCKVPSRWKS
ncbi:hypothetical protein KCP69_01810 [Salmonella enterica subsp. enterica]|nr:hypothetical protein KCP69_01810 [Salmonella enterica subsp. enterica]